MPPVVDVPLSPGSEGLDHGVNAGLPAVVEHGLVRLGLDGAEAVHPAHIVNAVHRLAPGPSAATSAVPIMLSRVTRAASCSSVMPPVPTGRSGRTR